MLTFVQSVILGIVEGFTEFLPISSTAHLILAAEFLGISQTDFAKTFEIAIQSGAIAAVVALYWREFLDRETIKKIVIAFIPTGVLGLLFYTLVKTCLIGNIAVVLWALALGGVFLILFERRAHAQGIRDVRHISNGTAMIIGVCQSVAMIPGVSRAAATIVGGMFGGVERETIVKFSFLLAVPTMLAATGLDLVKSYQAFSPEEFAVLAVGAAASFVMAIVSIKFLLSYVRAHSFTAFGVYRVLLVLAFLMVLR